MQGAAIIPGISRSGATIACALVLGVEREHAARFSFLLAIPAISGALLLQFLDLSSSSSLAWEPLLMGFLAACVSGFLALRLLVPIVRRGSFHYFAWS